jgi:very-short-patch-repair endonuclease
LSGHTAKQAAALVGINPKTLTSELRTRGIETGRRGTWRDLPAQEIADKYFQGASELALAAAYSVERGAIRSALLSQGVQTRGRSDAGLVRAAKMTAAERKAQAAAAHAASTGRIATWEERCLRAATVEQRPPAMSRHEQQAVGPYNIDFTVGTVAVEVLGGEWHGYKATRHARRTPYILDQGWSMAFLWATANCPMTHAAADYVIAFADELARDPSPGREYRVVRGDGYLIARGCRDDDEFAGIPAARHGANPFG